MQLPLPLLESLQGIKGFDREAFEKIHSLQEQLTSIRLNPAKPVSTSFIPSLDSKIPWASNAYYLSQRPSFTFDPLFHAGCYYVQEASSMFLEEALKQSVDLTKPLRVLDLSAAPGGKSTHIQSLINAASLLVSNEVIRSRAGVLQENIIKWGCENVIVTQNDPKDFSKLEGFFDVVVVDAPCSGSGLFRRDPDAITEWSPTQVNLCSQRQQRILADVMPALKNQGILIYSTCSYSKEEDEDIANWLTQNFHCEPVQLSIPGEWNIIDTGSGYRFWPDQLKGEGFFISCFKKLNGRDEAIIKTQKPLVTVTSKEKQLIKEWMDISGKYFIKNDNRVYAWPEQLKEIFSFLLHQLRFVYSGVLTGELVRDKLVPEHPLAMSNLVSSSIMKTQLNYEDAIRYLQRKEIQLSVSQKGWQLVQYEGQNLGWINALAQRINNYYPKNLRILKQQ